MKFVHRTKDKRYGQGVEEFLKLAYCNKEESSKLPCPCKSCNNFRLCDKNTVYLHLMQRGISVNYDMWIYHGEICEDVLDNEDLTIDESDGDNNDDYNDDLKLRHNIDIMHVVKNVIESIVATIFDIKGNTKDTWKSLKDLMEQGLKKGLHFQPTGLQIDKECALTSVNMSRKWYQDQPYVLVSQVKQVFYVLDLKLGKNWHVVQSFTPRTFYDVPQTLEAAHIEVYQEEEPNFNLVVDLNIELPSLARGIIALQLVDASIILNLLIRRNCGKMILLIRNKEPSQDESSQEASSLSNNFEGSRVRHLLNLGDDTHDHVDTQLRGNFEEKDHTDSTSQGTSTMRGLTRNLAHAKKRRHDKEIIVEIDECAGCLVGEDSQELITKGGCILRQFAKFDGTTWKHQPKELKDDIISKCMENLNYDGSKKMESAIQRQLGNHHKNKQYRLHLHFKKFSSKEKALKNPPINVRMDEWVKLCDKFTSDNFQDDLRSEEVSSSYSPIEICMQKLRGILGHIKGRVAPTKLIVASEKLQMEIETERKRADEREIQSATISAKLATQEEEEMQVSKEQHTQFHEQIQFMMVEISRLASQQSDKNISASFIL
ncbi:Transposase-associated domain [Dillenia turbinata]|uniref:Transposase-associated domain n=1 Tax=Dillenia turbinata TaxID=194707 RepID=A0AAN8VM22_9MAGN